MGKNVQSTVTGVSLIFDFYKWVCNFQDIICWRSEFSEYVAGFRSISLLTHFPVFTLLFKPKSQSRAYHTGHKLLIARLLPPIWEYPEHRDNPKYMASLQH